MKIVQDSYYPNQKAKNNITEKKASLLKGIDPKILESFELQEFLGSGSESEVYKAYIKNSKRTVAMKMILLKKNQKKNINEINISKKLKNKNIINFYVAGEFKRNELYCIITEYAQYGNLKQFQQKIREKKKNLSEPLICFITYQILNGLKYCHLCKIVHFDLKPQNIIIDNYLNIKIIDFSISLDYSKIKSSQIRLPLKGTSLYISPEVIKSEKIYIKDLNKIDLYSLGIILYNLAFNSFPFSLEFKDINNFVIIYEKIMKELTINNESDKYSSYFIDFINKLLEKDINKRININEALNNYWVKGAEILLEEKEKICNDDIFLNDLIYEHFNNFDNYIIKKS